MRQPHALRARRAGRARLVARAQQCTCAPLKSALDGWRVAGTTAPAPAVGGCACAGPAPAAAAGGSAPPAGACAADAAPPAAGGAEVAQASGAGRATPSASDSGSPLVAGTDTSSALAGSALDIAAPHRDRARKGRGGFARGVPDETTSMKNCRFAPRAAGITDRAPEQLRAHATAAGSAMSNGRVVMKRGVRSVTHGAAVRCACNQR